MAFSAIFLYAAHRSVKPDPRARFSHEDFYVLDAIESGDVPDSAFDDVVNSLYQAGYIIREQRVKQQRHDGQGMAQGFSVEVKDCAVVTLRLSREGKTFLNQMRRYFEC